jgi:branched-chain amino acid aminotransferase
MPLPQYAFLNGKIIPYSEANVGVLTHALNYGTGAFGGVRGYWNEDEKQVFIFRPFDHFKRFLESGRILRMTFPYSVEDLVKVTQELIKKEGLKGDCYIRPLAFYSDEIIGVRLHDLNPFLSICAMPFGRYVDKEEGAHVTVSSWKRIDDNIIPARGKIAGSYVNSAFAKSDAQLSGFDEAILLNEDGHVSEGSAENIFMVRNGVLITPPITDNLLEGITRNTILNLARKDLKLEVDIRSIDRSELFVAEELFLAGTGVQIASIIKVDHRPIGSGSMGPITTKIRNMYFDVVRGKVKKYRDWCHPVY